MSMTCKILTGSFNLASEYFKMGFTPLIAEYLLIVIFLSMMVFLISFVCVSVLYTFYKVGKI